MFITVSTLGNLIYNGEEGSERASQTRFKEKESYRHSRCLPSSIEVKRGDYSQSRLLVWAAGEMALPGIRNGAQEEWQDLKGKLGIYLGMCGIRGALETAKIDIHS